MPLSRSQLERDLDRMASELSDWATQARRREIYQAQVRNHVLPLLASTAANDRDYARGRILAMLEVEGMPPESVLAFLPELG